MPVMLLPVVDDVVPQGDIPVDERVLDVVGTVRVPGMPRACTVVGRLEGGAPNTVWFVAAAAAAVLVPGSTSSVEPAGIPVLADAVPVAIAGMVGALVVELQMLGIDKSVDVGLVVPLTPPPSKVEAFNVPVGEHAALPALVATPTVVGPRPPGLTPTAPMGMPIGPAGAVGVNGLPVGPGGVRGEVGNGPGVAVTLCARLGPPSESVAIVTAISKRAVGSLWSSRIEFIAGSSFQKSAKPRMGLGRASGSKLFGTIPAHELRMDQRWLSLNHPKVWAA